MSDIENCFKCGQTPDDILMLTCSHDLCLVCASKALASQSKHSRKGNQENITCEICASVTELDSTSVCELQEMYERLHIHTRHDSPPMALQKQKTVQRTNDKSSKTNQKAQLDTSNFQLSEKENIMRSTDHQGRSSVLNSHRAAKEFEQHYSKHQKEACPDHPEEDLYYFCFTCLCHCICPECVVHGVHKDHDVKTIKKSHPIVKLHLETAIESNHQILNHINMCKEEIDKRHQLQNNLVQKYKYQIQQEFEIIHQTLNAQEKLLVESLNSIPTMLQRYEAFAQHCKQVEFHVRNLNSTIQKQFQFKEETKLLNFYSEFSQIQLPKLDVLPNYTEPQTNHQEILDNLSTIRKSIETVQLSVYAQTLTQSIKGTRLQTDDLSAFMNESLKTLDKRMLSGY